MRSASPTTSEGAESAPSAMHRIIARNTTASQPWTTQLKRAFLRIPRLLNRQVRRLSSRSRPKQQVQQQELGREVNQRWRRGQGKEAHHRRRLLRRLPKMQPAFRADGREIADVFVRENVPTTTLQRRYHKPEQHSPHLGQHSHQALRSRHPPTGLKHTAKVQGSPEARAKGRDVHFLSCLGSARLAGSRAVNTPGVDTAVRAGEPLLP